MSMGNSGLFKGTYGARRIGESMGLPLIDNAYVNDMTDISSDVYYRLHGEELEKYQHNAFMSEYWTDGSTYVCIALDENKNYIVFCFSKMRIFEYAESFKNHKDAKNYFKQII